MFCEKCNGTGFIVSFDDTGKCVSEKCECYDIEMAKRLIPNSGMIREKRFDNFKPINKLQSDIKKKCMEYKPAESIMLLGQVGAGKTHLSMAIGNKLLDDGIGVIYMDYRKVIGNLKFSMIDRENFVKELYKYINARILIIDDLFKGGASDAEIRIMFELVDERYKNGKSFIVSCENSFDELMGIDQAITSRLAENSTIIDFGNDIKLNYRLRR